MEPLLARRERLGLCDLALAVGEDAPTLCGGWDARHLVAHLLVRERRPLGALGLVVPHLSTLTDRAMERYLHRDFTALVEALRRPGPTPFVLPGVEGALNTLEYFVHHEDLRRARPGWEPRDLDRADLDLLWARSRAATVFLTRAVDVPLVLRRDDTGQRVTVRRGGDPVTVTGPAPELTLFLYGRREVQGLAFDGPEDRVAAVATAR